MLEVQITGLEQVQKRMEEAPSVLVMRAFAKALDRAGGVIAAEVEAMAPEHTGELRENVIVGVEVFQKGGRALIGFNPSRKHEESGAPMDAVAEWVEMGHRLVTHKPDKKEISFVPAHPFMRPAFEVAGERAIEVFAEALIEGLSEMWGAE